MSEGYLNVIRLVAGEDSQRAVEYYDDFIAYAVENKELYAAAMAAREVAEYSLRTGLVWDRHYLERSAELWVETARANHGANGPIDLSANAYLAAIDAATSLADLAMAGRVYGELAELPLRRDAAAALPRARAAIRAEPRRRLAAQAFPAVLRRRESYQDIWRDDMVEWELDGDAVAVLARLIADDATTRLRAAGAARAADVRGPALFAVTSCARGRRCGRGGGRVQAYEVLRPLERLFEHEAPEVRAAVVRGAAMVWTRRTFDLVRRRWPTRRRGRRCRVAVAADDEFRRGLPPLVADLPRGQRTSVSGWPRWKASAAAKDAGRGARVAGRRPPGDGGIRRAAEAKLEKLVKTGGEEVVKLIRSGARPRGGRAPRRARPDAKAVARADARRIRPCPGRAAPARRAGRSRPGRA